MGSLQNNNHNKHITKVKWDKIELKGSGHHEQRPFIGTIDQAPRWMYEKYKYLYTGHRINFSSNKILTKSLFQCHNQLFNTWSHLVTAGILFFYLCKLYFRSDLSELIYHENYTHINYREQTEIPVWPFYVSCISAIFCCLASSAYHLYCDKSHKQDLQTKRVDYMGIAVVASGGMTSTYFYGFYCQKSYQFYYLAFGYTVSTVIMIISLFEKFHSNSFRKIKISVYALLTFTSVVPMIHLMIQSMNAGNNNKFLSLNNSIIFYKAALFSAILPQIIYIIRIPERFFPGKFDIIGQSHNIWHIGASGIMIFVTLGSVNDYLERIELQC